MKKINTQQSADSEFYLFHISEALADLDRIRDALEEPGSTIEDLTISASLAHVYEHLNWCWNGRKRQDRSSVDLSEDEFRLFSCFPTDMEDLMVMKHRKIRS